MPAVDVHVPGREKTSQVEQPGLYLTSGVVGYLAGFFMNRNHAARPTAENGKEVDDWPLETGSHSKSHIANGTAKSVGSHSVSNIRCHGISVEDCATTEILVSAFDAVPGPGTMPGPGIVSNAETSISVMPTEPIKIPLKVAFSALIFSKSASYA